MKSKPRLSLTSFLWLATCVALLVVIFVDRQRTAHLKEQSVIVSDPKWRELARSEWKLHQRNLKLFDSLDQMRERYGDSFSERNLSADDRKLLANMRNSKLKLVRENKRLMSIRSELTPKSKRP